MALLGHKVDAGGNFENRLALRKASRSRCLTNGVIAACPAIRVLSAIQYSFSAFPAASGRCRSAGAALSESALMMVSCRRAT